MRCRACRERPNQNSDTLSAAATRIRPAAKAASSIA
jgi:hypothetical protein